MNIDYYKLGRRIAQRRHEQGLKQCVVAEKSLISNNYLSNIENGKSIPSLETFINICNSLSTTPDYFLIGVTRDNNIPQSIQDNLKLCNEHSIKIINEIIITLLNNQK